MIHWLFTVVIAQVLLADIGNVAALTIFSEQMVKGLVAVRPDILRDGLIPFLAIGEDGVDVEYHTPKAEQTVLHHIANAKTGMSDNGGVKTELRAGWPRNVRVHVVNLERLRIVTRRVLGKRNFIR
jgi:hypothetical protein